MTPRRWTVRRAALLTAPLWGLLGLFAQAAPLQATDGQYTVQIPAGARSLVIARGNMKLSAVALPAGLRQLSLKLSVSPARYRETVSFVRNGQPQASTLVVAGPFTPAALKSAALRPELGRWLQLWDSTQPSTASVSFNLGGKPMTGQTSATAFKVRLLISAKPPAQLQLSRRPPLIP